MVHAVLHLINPANPGNDMSLCLTESEQARATRFVFPDDATRWSIYRSELRRILGQALEIEGVQVPLIEGPNGKPAVAPPFEALDFNLSHSDDLAVVVTSESGPVGIDIEPWARAPSLIGCEEAFCHPLELQELPIDSASRATRLLEIWTAKEAILKALGTGLSYPPQQIRIIGDHAHADTPLEGISDFRIQFPEHPRLSNHHVAVAVLHTIDGVVWNDTASPI